MEQQPKTLFERMSEIARGNDPLKVRCPRCASPAGANCVNARFPHSERLDAVREAREQRTHDSTSAIDDTDERRPIMLEMAAADERHKLFERRWRAAMAMQRGDVPFVDAGGPWGTRDLLSYLGEAAGFRMED